MNRIVCVTVLPGLGSLLVDSEANINTTTDLKFSVLWGLLLSVLFMDLDLPRFLSVEEEELALVLVEIALL